MMMMMDRIDDIRTSDFIANISATTIYKYWGHDDREYEFESYRFEIMFINM